MNGHLYTRWGDSGETSLVGGTRVRKDSARVCAYGSVDETNSHVGLARAALGESGVGAREGAEPLDRMLAFVQQRLFNCSSNLATPPDPSSTHTPGVSAEDIATLELWIDAATERVGGFAGFVLPGGSEAAARLHVARTVARRAEREIITLAALEPVDPTIIAFINRVSDLLFAAAREANHLAGTTDELWNPRIETPGR